MKKLYLLDAFALIFRAYYALAKSPRITSFGKNTNAQLGFTNTLLEIIHKEAPTHIAVAFDTAAPTERHLTFENYKAQRQETPEDIIAAVPDIKKILQAFKIPTIELDGFEADDIIGTLAVQAAKEDYEIFMVSPDKDYGQLVNDKIFIYKPAFQKNERKILGVAEVCEIWDIKKTEQLIDILGLMGDAVDNIPGVAGIGEKTAAKLIKEYDNIENLIVNAHQIKGILGEKIKNQSDLAILSKKLATINKNVPLDIDIKDLAYQAMDKQLVKNVFQELEFKTLLKRVLGETETPNLPQGLFDKPQQEFEKNLNENASENNILLKTIKNTPHEYVLIQNEHEVKNLLEYLSSFSKICIDTETTGLDTMSADLVGMSFCAEKGKAFYIAVPKEKEKVIELLTPLNQLFENSDILWIGQNLKYDLSILYRYQIIFKGKFFDTMLVQYLLDSETKRSMDFLSMKYLQYEPISIETLIGEKGKKQKSMRDINVDLVKEYAAEDADITFQLYCYFIENQLIDSKTKQILEEIEFPLMNVLLSMEQNGISIDSPFLKQVSDTITKELLVLEKKIYELTDSVFNIASPKQLGDILFDKLNIIENNKAQKTKTGQFSTDDTVLEKLLDKHPVIEFILSYRELSKLKSTYVDALPLLVNSETHRIHTTFNQTRAVTGRLSSINPNLQNIPVRTTLGKQMRKAFICKNDSHILLSADYSQIELRIIAALSNDKNMIDAFIKKQDIHTATAAKIYQIQAEEVSKEMRYKAKSVNFGIIYGQGAWGLSQNISVPQKEAKKLIENYFIEYPNIKKYMDNQILFAKENGFVETLSGRKRWLRDIHSANHTVRGFAERNAINMPIQGTAADMIKLAMIQIHQAMLDNKMNSKMILQVHDELLFEVVLEEKQALQTLIQNTMPFALKLPNEVPVEIDMGFGKNWLEAH